MVLIISCVGFALNVISATVLHGRYLCCALLRYALVIDIDIKHREDVKRVTSISQGSAIAPSSAAEVTDLHSLTLKPRPLC